MKQYSFLNHIWIKRTLYPKKNIASYIYIIFVVILIYFVCFYSYPVYKKYYGVILEDNKNVIKIPVLINEIDSFQKLIKKNNIVLYKVENKIMVQGNQNYVYVYVKKSIKKDMLIKNNVIYLKLKDKKITFLEEQLNNFRKE